MGLIAGRVASPWAIFAVTVVFAGVVAWLLMGLPRPESQLPWPGLVRDVVYERQAVDAALGLANAPGHARTPGAVFVLLPLALIPPEFLTSWITMVSVVSVGMIAAGAVRLRRPSLLAGLGLSLALPVSVAFIQAVFHGSTFLPFAACLVWLWVFLREGRPIVAGSLLAVAGVSRLWPLLLVVVLVRRRLAKAAMTTLGMVAALTASGLMLPGVSLGGSVTSVVGGGEGWITADHNGSLASWLIGLGAMPAAVIGLGVVLAVWVVGMLRSRTLDSDIAWTMPAAVFASPLAWLPYLLALTPLTLTRRKSLVPTVSVAAIVIIQLLGYRLLSQQFAMSATLLLVAAVSWSEWLGGGPTLVSKPETDDAGNRLKADPAQPMGHSVRSR